MFIDNSCWLLLKLPHAFFLLFTFTSPPSMQHVPFFERLLCLLTLSFCSSSIHLFSFFGPSVFSRFFHLFFALFEFFIGLGCPFVFSIDILSSHFWIFVNFCSTFFFCFPFFSQKHDFVCFLSFDIFPFFLSSFFLWSFFLRVFSSLRRHFSLFVQCLFSVFFFCENLHCHFSCFSFINLLCGLL